MAQPGADYRGARGSNAGDQFHELWALDRALSLLNPSTDLQALTVEGITLGEEPGDGTAAAWDGVDCALYYGGRSLATADRIEIAQLKYSGSDPTAPWTIARLTKNTKKKGNNSALAKLAESFNEACKYMRAGAGLTIKFISNQPIATEVLELLGSQRTSLSAGTSLDPEVTDNLRKVSQATGLAGDDLAAFLRTIDTSGCGSVSRFAKKEAIVSFVSEAIGDDTGSQVRELQTRDPTLGSSAYRVSTGALKFGLSLLSPL